MSCNFLLGALAENIVIVWDIMGSNRTEWCTELFSLLYPISSASLVQLPHGGATLLILNKKLKNMLSRAASGEKSLVIFFLPKLRTYLFVRKMALLGVFFAAIFSHHLIPAMPRTGFEPTSVVSQLSCSRLRPFERRYANWAVVPRQAKLLICSYSAKIMIAFCLQACNRGNRGVVRVLLEFGADLNLKGFGKDSPLHDAARNGHLKVGRLLFRVLCNP